MLHPKFATDSEQYVRAFLLLQKDLLELFDFVEPADTNLPTYSYRMHSLLLRACVEVEANCKAVLKENGYSKSSNMKMGDYKKLNLTHHLSSYEVKIPNWSGVYGTRQPFAPWSNGDSLPWYQAYNNTKHSRHEEFESATFEHLIDATCAVLVLLSAQFETNDFSSHEPRLVVEGPPNDGMESAIGDYFRVKFPNDWPEEMRYDFDWQELKKENDPFDEIDFSAVAP